MNMITFFEYYKFQSLNLNFLFGLRTKFMADLLLIHISVFDNLYFLLISVPTIKGWTFCTNIFQMKNSEPE